MEQSSTANCEANGDGVKVKYSVGKKPRLGSLRCVLAAEGYQHYNELRVKPSNTCTLYTWQRKFIFLSLFHEISNPTWHTTKLLRNAKIAEKERCGNIVIETKPQAFPPTSKYLREHVLNSHPFSQLYGCSSDWKSLQEVCCCAAASFACAF